MNGGIAHIILDFCSVSQGYEVNYVLTSQYIFYLLHKYHGVIYATIFKIIF